MNKSKPRVAIFTHNYPVNSKERKDAGIFVYDFAHELSKHASVFIFCPDFGIEGKELYKTVPVKWLKWGGPTAKFGNWPIFSPISIFNFFRLIIVGSRQAEIFVKENKIDFCLACWSIPSSIYTMWVNIKLRIPYAVWLLGSDLNIYAKLPILNLMTTMALRRAVARFSNSHWLMNMVQRISGKKCHYMAAITNFVETKKVKIRFIDQKVFNFLSVGRLEKVKGPDVLINACGILKQKNPNFKLHILGDGTMRGALEKRILELNLTDNIVFYGNTGRDKIISFMKLTDSLVSASRNESIPMVIVEAARWGLPTVATDVGDCRYVIEKYKIGYIAKSENPESLSNIMFKVMSKGKMFKKECKIGLSKISNDFVQSEQVDTLLRCVSSVL